MTDPLQRNLEGWYDIDKLLTNQCINHLDVKMRNIWGLLGLKPSHACQQKWTRTSRLLWWVQGKLVMEQH